MVHLIKIQKNKISHKRKKENNLVCLREVKNKLTKNVTIKSINKKRKGEFK